MLTGGRLWLGREDSNLRSRDQNPLPYRLATPQSEQRENSVSEDALPDGRRHPRARARADPKRGGTGVAKVVEEGVDRGAGATHVGTKRSCGEQRDERRAARRLGQVVRGKGYEVARPPADGQTREEALAPLVERARATGCVVTSGLGPRYLHSTGQLHKGGPPTGVFIQVIDEHGDELAVPGRPFGFARLIRAQADGDYAALRERGRRITRIRLEEIAP